MWVKVAPALDLKKYGEILSRYGLEKYGERLSDIVGGAEKEFSYLGIEDRRKSEGKALLSIKMPFFSS